MKIYLILALVMGRGGRYLANLLIDLSPERSSGQEISIFPYTIF